MAPCHRRGLPSGERPSRLRRGHDRRAVRPRSGLPSRPARRVAGGNAYCVCTLPAAVAGAAHVPGAGVPPSLVRRDGQALATGRTGAGRAAAWWTGTPPAGAGASAPRRPHGKPNGFAKVRPSSCRSAGGRWPVARQGPGGRSLVLGRVKVNNPISCHPTSSPPSFAPGRVGSGQARACRSRLVGVGARGPRSWEGDVWVGRKCRR